MTRPTAIFLLALGLILDLAVSDRVSGINLHIMGIILAVIGGLALLYSIIVER